MLEKNLNVSHEGMIKRNGKLLQKELEDNARRLERLAQEQARAVAELSKVEHELEELNALYPGGKRRRQS